MRPTNEGPIPSHEFIAMNKYSCDVIGTLAEGQKPDSNVKFCH